MRRIAVIGLSAFGTALVQELAERRCNVLAVDTDENRVNAIREFADEAVIADACDPRALEALRLNDYDAVVLSLGERLDASLLAVLHGVYSDEVDRERLGEEMTSRLARTLERAAEARERHADRVLDVQFRELVRDKLGTVRKIHEHFGYEHDDRTEERMRGWLEEHPHHAGHRYELEQFGLSKDMLEGAFRAYREEFGIARES